MIQGTTSDAGKSTLVAGLCRWLSNRGEKVVPFKPQNMALNSAVTADGGEIGRAQAVQAQAARLQPHTDMNPVLLKPNSDTGAQVIIHGKAVSNLDARAYHDYKQTAMRAVMASWQRLCGQYDWIIVEGAGSPAEINLRDKDIANMGFAEAADCPVIIIADIDRGGVFAHCCGTLDLLSASEQQRTCGFVINRFRGDLSLLQPGLEWLEERTGKTVFGVLPWLKDLHLEAEDSINAQQLVDRQKPVLNVVVPVLPRISNHTDFDVLRLHPQVNLQFVALDQSPPPADLVILPGSKHVQADLAQLQQHHWPDYLQRHLRYGGKLLGICGGYQMLGKQLHDPDGVEGPPGSCVALGLLEFDTVLQPHKQLQCVRGHFLHDQSAVSGYEIHMGVSQGPALQRPAIKLEHGHDGVMSEDGQIMGTYLHGLFDQNTAMQSLLRWAGLNKVESMDYARLQDEQLDRLADSLDQHLDITALLDCGEQHKK